MDARVTGVWAGQGASSSCLKSGRKSQQISYRDDCWSGSFHPAPQGSRHGDFGKKHSHPLITISCLTPLAVAAHPPLLPPPRVAVQPSMTDARQWEMLDGLFGGPAALAPLKRCRINTEQPLRTAVPKDRKGICTSVWGKTVQMLTENNRPTTE